MPIAVQLSESLVQEAKSASDGTSRTLSEQIEYWVLLGKASDENPDLPVPILQDILASQAEKNLNKLSKFRFG
ncbi:MAG: hypothetical protein WCH33_09390 [Betaproteobacteria bacterium]